MNLSSITQITTAKIAPGAITEALINDDVSVNNKVVPVGAIMAFAKNAVPSGWLLTNGAAVSRTTYATLFANIGTTYGAGNGSTTFELPDLRGYFVRGYGTNGDGTASGAFGANQTAYAGYNTFNAYKDDGDQQTGSRGELTGLTVNGTSIFGTYSANSRSYSKSIATTPGDTRPKNIALLYCIKF